MRSLLYTSLLIIAFCFYRVPQQKLTILSAAPSSVDSLPGQSPYLTSLAYYLYQSSITLFLQEVGGVYK